MTRLWTELCSVWILAVWVQVLHCVLSSHFQGASVSWRPGRFFADEGKREILIDFRVVWRRGTIADSPVSFCDEQGVAKGVPLGDTTLTSLNWLCKSGCSGTVASAVVPCTQFDEQDDWSVGSQTEAYNITISDDPFAIEFSGCCWISSLVFAASTSTDWRLTMTGSTGNRSDTNMPNRSPISAVTPIIRFQAGCPDYVDLLVFDADQDNIICKFEQCTQATCTLYPYLKLTQNENKCRLSYNGGGPGDTNVAISMLLEDRPRKEGLLVNGTLQNTTTVLSSVPMQFIVKLHTESHLCSLKPLWIDPTFPSGLVKTAVVGVELRVKIRLLSITTLDVVNVIAPRGLDHGPIDTSSNTLSDSKEYWTNLVFTATREQIGTHMVCITAKDTNGKMSEQRCMILKVGEGTPCDVDNGGCADKCIPMGSSSYVCECERNCWRIAEDRRTCIPDIDIECLPDLFSVELPACSIGKSSVSIGYQIGSATAPCKADNNGTYYKKEVNYDACLTHKKSDFWEIHYMSRLRMFVKDEMDGSGDGDKNSAITRGFFYNMDLVCSFNKYANVNMTFRPQDREEGLVQVPGLGSFQFFFDFYMDENFGATYSPYEYPITVTVNSDLYFAIRTVGGSGLEVFTEKCVAMTTPTPTADTVSYTMIENGCFIDKTLARHAGANDMEDRFSIKAFRFQDNLNTGNSVNIYIQCSAVLCIVGDPTTRCRKGCIQTRKRRGGSDEIFVDPRQRRSVDDSVTIGPTIEPNVTESELLDIAVSGPIRIQEVQTEGTPLATVVTSTNSVGHTTNSVGHTMNSAGHTTNSASHTTTTQAAKPETTEKSAETPNESDSLTMLIIASSVGAVLFLLFLLSVLALVCYYHHVLKPRRKIIPDKEDFPRRSVSVSAWVSDGQNERNLSRERSVAETPPPSFWDLHTDVTVGDLTVAESTPDSHLSRDLFS